ncbi:MAG: cytochrome c oxidase assembly protein [Pseudomonadota bacterium]|nr:cytochrome c oxidase assembly protein [Pseudomonadota bacterium]
MIQENLRQANRRLLRRLLLATAAMFAFGFALVPLYDVFCAVTGLNGKTAPRAAVVSDAAVDAKRTVTVEFVASLNAGAPWEFAPAVRKMQVHPGQMQRTSYFARNLTDAALVGQAVPSVAPGQAAGHFQKIECFCFTRQAFAAHEDKEMWVAFRLDPDLPADITTVTLSYTLFRVDGQGG